MNQVGLPKRHEGHDKTNLHNSHYANLQYGNKVFYAMLVYLVVVLLVKKIYYYNVINKFLKKHYKLKKFVVEFVQLNPLLHIVIIGAIALLEGFFDFKITKMSVYFKKMARLSYVLTITNLFLVIPRSNFFIFMSYLDSIKLHVWLSTLILILAIVHSILFIVKWTIQGVLFSKIFKLQNFIGLTIFVKIVVLLVLSLTSYRRKNYQNFYAIHQIAMFSFVVMTILHSDPQVITPFGFINITFLLIMIVNKIINNVSRNDDSFTIDEVKEYGVLKTVNFKNTKVNSMIDYFLSDDVFAAKMIPGSHIRLHESSIISLDFWLKPSHPFTLVNNKQLIIKNNEFSRFTSYSMKKLRDLSLVGIYHPNQEIYNLIDSLNSSGKKNVVTLVAGGSGISFVLSILTYIMKLNLNDKVFVYWSIKNIYDALIITDFLNDYELNNINFELALRINVSQFVDSPEMLERKSETETVISKLQAKDNIDISIDYNNRLEMVSIVDNHKQSADIQNGETLAHWNVCCGPSLMIDGCRQAVEAYNESISSSSPGSIVEFISEEYQF